MSEEQVQNPQPAEEKRSGSSFSRVVIVVVVIAIIAAAGYFLMNKTSTAVAIVNGQPITRAEYDQRYAQMTASVVAQGQSATSTQIMAAIQTQTLDTLISEALLLQAAAKEGITVNETTVTAQLAQNKSQFPDDAAYQKAMTAAGFTPDTFKANLEKNNIIQQYLAKHVDVSSATASAAEVQALYNQVASANKNVPPLAQVRTQVENQIIQQKQQQLISNFLQQLRASSTIQTLLK